MINTHEVRDSNMHAAATVCTHSHISLSLVRVVEDVNRSWQYT